MPNSSKTKPSGAPNAEVTATAVADSLMDAQMELGPSYPATPADSAQAPARRFDDGARSSSVEKSGGRGAGDAPSRDPLAPAFPLTASPFVATAVGTPRPTAAVDTTPATSTTNTTAVNTTPATTTTAEGDATEENRAPLNRFFSDKQQRKTETAPVTPGVSGAGAPARPVSAGPQVRPTSAAPNRPETARHPPPRPPRPHPPKSGWGNDVMKLSSEEEEP